MGIASFALASKPTPPPSPPLPVCRVARCRYPETHITAYHCCGKCQQYGHGQIECGDEAATTALRKIANDNPASQRIAKHLWCTFAGCRARTTHSLEVHLRDSIKGPGAIDKIVQDELQDGVDMAYNTAVIESTRAVIDRPGTVCKVHYGHGWYAVVWNVDGDLHYGYQGSTLPPGLTEVPSALHG